DQRVRIHSEVLVLARIRKGEQQYSGGGSARMSLLILISIFACSASVMYLVYRNFPELSVDEQEKIKIPKDMEDAKALGTVLSKYKDTYYTQVLLAYFATYILYPLCNW
uniref:Transmembrane protein 41B n=1 Tax=Astyanax mexicanus TaxID=7994 RepID=A0A3B1JR51_ASTMX